MALSLPGLARGQEAGGVPALPGGVSAVLLPVQAAVPLPSGGWPAGAGSRQELLERMNAELQYALEARGPDAGDWHPPAEVVERTGRNPALDVEPTRLAASLLGRVTRGDRIPAPLHGQLRRIAALFGARHLLVPTRVGYRSSDAGDGAAADSAPADTAGGPGGPEPRTTGRAVLDLALVDIRRGVLLWRGTVRGEEADRDSPALLATLAARLAADLVPGAGGGP